jgi:Rrp15p
VRISPSTLSWSKLKTSTTHLERKRRAVPSSSFGQALTALLETSTSKTATEAPEETGFIQSASTSRQNATDSAVLALKKTSLAKKRRAEEKSEAKAARAQIGERTEREERNRVRDVIGGWGGESERALRKVAQRGGTFLTNASGLY